MHEWRVGDVQILRIDDFDLPLPSDERLPEWMVPTWGPSVDEYRTADSVVAIRDGDTRIVIDPWLLSFRPADDAAEHSRRLLDELAAVDFDPADVDFVVNTHLDGLGWNTVPDGEGWRLAFPNAAYLYPTEDVDSVERGDDRGDEAHEFRHLATLTEVTAVDESLSLTPSVSARRSGGHGWGHQVVRIERSGDVAVHLGHLVVHPGQFPNPDYATEDNLDAPAVRRRQLGAVADEGGLAITALVGGPGGGRVIRDGDGFRL